MDALKKEARSKCTECNGGESTPCTPCYFRDEYIDRAAAETIKGIENNLPSHKGSLSITHNGHRDSYESVEEYLAWFKAKDKDFVTPTSKQRMIENDTVWEMQWYPDTPIGFIKVYAATIEELLDFHFDL